MSSSLVQLSSPTLADQAYTALREAIVGGELSRGEKITERGLADRLQVSPTPVREALRRLEQDRLIERTGPRSVRVADFDDADIAEVTAIEDTLRGLAARMAATAATAGQLERMERELDAAEAALAKVQAQARPSKKAVAAAAERAFEHTRAFHRMLDEASNSTLLLHLLKMVEAFDVTQRRATLRQQLAAGELDVIGARFPEHRKIFDAVSGGDEALAERLVLEHCRGRSAVQQPL
jgi:DNA-binding GntR family transcriptional regulator